MTLRHQDHAGPSGRRPVQARGSQQGGASKPPTSSCEPIHSRRTPPAARRRNVRTCPCTSWRRKRRGTSAAAAGALLLPPTPLLLLLLLHATCSTGAGRGVKSGMREHRTCAVALLPTRAHPPAFRRREERLPDGSVRPPVHFRVSGSQSSASQLVFGVVSTPHLAAQPSLLPDARREQPSRLLPQRRRHQLPRAVHTAWRAPGPAEPDSHRHGLRLGLGCPTSCSVRVLRHQ
jgi:hypothetical protein